MSVLSINKKMYNIEGYEKNQLLYQYLSNKQLDMPCFCYSELLSVAGNCRMCLVEIIGSLKLVVSCATQVQSGMRIFTESLRLSRAREGVLELLLINHPLDCPICDQGGECDLQDLTIKYGSDKGRYYEYTKRAVHDLMCGVFVKTIMTRCIHCTRCIRFFSDIVGISEFGIMYRGENSEVKMSKDLLDGLSGNVVDLCPVGALTSKPYSFKARSWELNSVECFDIMDSMMSGLRVDVFLNKIRRILPIQNQELNEDWITNKARYFFDSLDFWRLEFCFKWGSENSNKVQRLSWGISLLKFLSYLFFGLLKGYGVNTNLDNFCSLNKIQSLKKFFTISGLLNNSFTICDFRSFFFLEVSANMWDKFKYVFFLGVNLRLELPLLSVRCKFNLNRRFSCFFSFGLGVNDLVLQIKGLGNSLNSFLKFLKGRNVFFDKFKEWINVDLLFKVNKNTCLFLFSEKFSDLYSSILLWKLKFYFQSLGMLVNFYFISPKVTSMIVKELNFNNMRSGLSNNLNLYLGNSVYYFKRNFSKKINIFIGSVFNKLLYFFNLILSIKSCFEIQGEIFLNLFGLKVSNMKFIDFKKDELKNENIVYFIFLWLWNKYFLNIFSFIPIWVFRRYFNLKSMVDTDEQNFDLIISKSEFKVLKEEICSSLILNKVFNSGRINYYKDDVDCFGSKVLSEAGNLELKKKKIWIRS